MDVVLAPDSYKGALDAPSAAEAMAEGVLRARPGATVHIAPMADGGEGTLDILVDARGGQRRRITAMGPLGTPVDVVVGLIDEASTAVVELAAVSGYTLIADHERDPLRTSTYGLGEIIRTIIDCEIENVIITLGGSATVDGGAGMMQALGMRYLDYNGREMSPGVGGGDLSRIRRMRWIDPPENIENVQFTIACDVLNPACGPNGAAAVFGPQKGADAAGVICLQRGLEHWADLLADIRGCDLRDNPGTGAAGGVALPLLAMTNASLVPGVDLVGNAIGLPTLIPEADLVLTGEGRLDRQSLMGKVVGAIGRMCRTAEVPCVALVGAAGEDADLCLGVIDRYVTLDAPLDQTQRRLREEAAHLADEIL